MSWLVQYVFRLPVQNSWEVSSDSGSSNTSNHITTTFFEHRRHATGHFCIGSILSPKRLLPFKPGKFERSCNLPSARYRVLPLLVADPSLIPTQCQTRHAEEDGKEHSSNSRHYHITRSTASFKPFLHPPRRRVGKLFVQISESRPKVVIGNCFWVYRIANCCRIVP